MVTAVVLTALLLTAAPAASAVQPTPPAAIDLYNTGTARQAQGDLEGAVASFRQALALAPSHYDSHFNLGSALWALDRTSEALVEVMTAHNLAPQRPEAIAALAAMYGWLGQAKEAEHYEVLLAGLRQPVPSAPVDPYAAANRLTQQGLAMLRPMTAAKLWQAAKAFDQALLLAPKDGNALAGKALALGWLGAQQERNNKPAGNLFQQAGLLATKAAALPDAPPLAHVALAYTRYLRHDRNWTVPIQSAVRLGKANAYAHWIEALQLEQAQKPQAAWTQFREAMRLEPQQALFPMALGTSLAAANKDHEAEKAFSQALRLSPTYGEALSELAYTHLNQRNWKRAIEYFTKAIAQEPGNSLNHSALALAYLADERPAQALKHCETALTLDPGKAENHYRYAHLLEEAGSRTTADVAYRRAISLDPGSQRYKRAYERFLKTGKP